MKGTIVPSGSGGYSVETRERSKTEPILRVTLRRVVKHRGKLESWVHVSKAGPIFWTGAHGLEVWTENEATIEEIAIAMPTRGEWVWRDGGWKRNSA